MSYYGKLQVLKNGTADVEIQQWAYQQLEKAKTLTDEEITEIFDTTFEVRDFEDSFIKFARSILKRAQEK
jgi:hypothetical protein